MSSSEVLTTWRGATSASSATAPTAAGPDDRSGRFCPPDCCDTLAFDELQALRRQQFAQSRHRGFEHRAGLRMRRAEMHAGFAIPHADLDVERPQIHGHELERRDRLAFARHHHEPMRERIGPARVVHRRGQSRTRRAASTSAPRLAVRSPSALIQPSRVGGLTFGGFALRPTAPRRTRRRDSGRPLATASRLIGTRRDCARTGGVPASSGFSCSGNPRLRASATAADRGRCHPGGRSPPPACGRLRTRRCSAPACGANTLGGHHRHRATRRECRLSATASSSLSRGSSPTSGASASSPSPAPAPRCRRAS